VNRFLTVAAAATSLTAAACAPASAPADVPAADRPAGTVVAVADTMLPGAFEASGIARPYAEATIATKLMGAVTDVLVVEGQRVAVGAALVRVDAADLQAKDDQVAAQIAAAEASLADASVTATRMRALYADSAAPRAQLDAAEAGLARAKAAVAAARAGRDEVAAVRTYGTLRAPFDGTVTKRFVDPGAFATPGAPLVSLQDASRLRLSASIPASYAGALKRGAVLAARIEGAGVRATVEGVVPAAGAMYTVNAIVPNRDGRLPSGGAATLAVPTGSAERVLLVPDAAVVREGDLTGVRVSRAGRAELRWVRIGGAVDGRTRVLTGLSAGDSVVVPTAGR
jgi:RND family efflux transporter MFP subunit